MHLFIYFALFWGVSGAGASFDSESLFSLSSIDIIAFNETDSDFISLEDFKGQIGGNVIA